MTSYHCNNCQHKYSNKIITKCEKCGGKFTDIRIKIDGLQENKELPGIWKYKYSFGLPNDAPVVSLGEGNTPLIRLSKSNIYFKCEHQNPTGSFKDRLVSPIISLLKSKNIKEAVEDSSGNAGAAFAAYANSIGINAKVFVPSYASGPKRVQIESYGAELVSIEGSRYDTTLAINEYVKKHNSTYASHAHIPHGVAGIATIAYEIYDQLKEIPDYVVCPVGHGSLMAGLALGFYALKEARITNDIPIIIGIQSENFAPLLTRIDQNFESPLTKTIAEGASVLKPVFMDWLIDNQEKHKLRFAAIQENKIDKSRDEMARMGFYVEETSSIIWPIIKELALKDEKMKIIGILTGSGMKSG